MHCFRESACGAACAAAVLIPTHTPQTPPFASLSKLPPIQSKWGAAKRPTALLYNSKTDVWSLGFLIYELCALKPPFHEAKTEDQLRAFIRDAQIPPLPRGYSQALGAVIKTMLHLNVRLVL
ncbi:hypothetical protein B0H14DRAFT_3442788 [Mycena olivaceomarginata]|nr:hypothetical protein B0H14DRAFT_3442788 [Mycena olivaceomarginata]